MKTTWIDRFTTMQPGDVLMTISEDVSTLIAFLNEVRDLRSPSGEERDMSAMQAARVVVDEAADEVLTLRAKLRDCEDQFKATQNSRRLTVELRQNERIRELRAELESALDRSSALRDNEQILPTGEMPPIEVGDVVQGAPTWWDSVTGIEPDGAVRLRGWRVSREDILTVYRPVWRRGGGQ